MEIDVFIRFLQPTEPLDRFVFQNIDEKDHRIHNNLECTKIIVLFQVDLEDILSSYSHIGWF